MATTNIVQQEWDRLQARAFELFCEHRNVGCDDALLIALLEERAPELAARALALMDSDVRLSFSMAWRAVRQCDRFMEELPEPVRRAA